MAEPPMGMVLRELDQLGRRLDDAQQRITALDEHGGRGVAALQVQLQELSKDVVELTATFKQFRVDLRAGRWWLAGAYAGGLLPLYAFLAQQFLR